MNGFTAWLRDKAREILANLKRWYKSRTVWFNAVLLPVLVEYWPQIWDALPQLSAILPDDKYKALFTIGSVINVILRFDTTKAMRHK